MPAGCRRESVLRVDSEAVSGKPAKGDSPPVRRTIGAPNCLGRYRLQTLEAIRLDEGLSERGEVV
jgi:hypothetical protein